MLDDQRYLEEHTFTKAVRSAKRLPKRVIDVVVAATLILLLAPLFLIIAVMIVIADGRPVFFLHQRVGKGGRSFACIKFRSMRHNNNLMIMQHLAENEAAREEWANKVKLQDDPRVLPRIGKMLRMTSLDELPQLFNVLRGDMSLVGPRPVPADELERYQSHKVYYLAVQPGITGLWQVSGRNSTTYQRRIELDREYVERQSLWLDILILLRTISVVITREGAS